jgi:glutaredoxin-related protein
MGKNNILQIFKSSEERQADKLLDELLSILKILFKYLDDIRKKNYFYAHVVSNPELENKIQQRERFYTPLNGVGGLVGLGGLGGSGELGNGNGENIGSSVPESANNNYLTTQSLITATFIAKNPLPNKLNCDKIIGLKKIDIPVNANQLDSVVNDQDDTNLDNTVLNNNYYRMLLYYSLIRIILPFIGMKYPVILINDHIWRKCPKKNVKAFYKNNYFLPKCHIKINPCYRKALINILKCTPSRKDIDKWQELQKAVNYARGIINYNNISGIPPEFVTGSFTGIIPSAVYNNNYKNDELQAFSSNLDVTRPAETNAQIAYQISVTRKHINQYVITLTKKIYSVSLVSCDKPFINSILDPILGNSGDNLYPLNNFIDRVEPLINELLDAIKQK